MLENGLKICESNQANVKIVQLFALFHDSKRKNEHRDNGHGIRGAEFAKSLRGKCFNISDGEFALFYEACELHTNGLTDSTPTVQTCWDADRLDLPRVGANIYTVSLSTLQASKLIRSCSLKSIHGYVPELVLEWKR